MKLRYILAVILTLLFTETVWSQTYLSPRSIAYSQTYATQSRGADAIGWNPANLGYDDNPGFSLSFGVLPFVPFPSVYLGNSSVSASWYENYFRQGGTLDQATKNEILSVFPETGWRLDPQIYLRLLGLSVGRTAIALDTQVLNSVVLPKSIPELLLQGNRFDEVVSLDDFHVESLSSATFSLAHGFPLHLPFIPEFYVGIGVKAIAGLAYAATDTFSGGLTTYRDRIVADGNAIARYTLGGYGYAFDLGISSRLTNHMTANLAVNNIMGSIKWTDEYTRTHHYSFNLSTEVQNLYDTNLDSLISNSVSADTSYDSRGFTTPYPSYFVAGVQYDMFSRLRLFVNYKLGLSDLLISPTQPRISFAGEIRPLQWFPIRFGITSGSLNKVEWGAGFGLEFAHYSLLFGFSQTGGFLNDATGFSLAVGQELSF